MDRNTGFAQYGLRNAGQLVRIDPSLGIAEFISNSAILTAIRPRERKMATYRGYASQPAGLRSGASAGGGGGGGLGGRAGTPFGVGRPLLDRVFAITLPPDMRFQLCCSQSAPN